MGANQVFLELGLQGRLDKTDELVKAEYLAFRSLLIDYGLDATTVPKYSVTTALNVDANGAERWREVELKVHGTWSRLIVETRAQNVLVIHDRTPNP